jgi:aminoglycoside phosphotransferase family enzyme
MTPLTLTAATKVALLKEPKTYPGAPRQITAIETHMSWVFLTETHAYKMKKPVLYPYLDFSTLSAREWNCREEFRLNQRLAPGVYLGVVPLCLDPSGVVRVEGEGDAVEWLVKMRRLPADRMLNRLIEDHALAQEDVRRVAELLVEFYRESTPIAVNEAAYRERIAVSIARNQEVLARPEYGLTAALIESVHGTLTRLVENQPALFDRRVREGRIVEGHGDLRPEHVCLVPQPIVFDRLEFNRDLRVIDPAEELSFLAMECERLGARFVGETLFAAYTEAAGDAPPQALLDFYMAHRACVRARLAALHTIDAPRATWPKWITAAAAYLQLAASYCDRLARTSIAESP